MPRTRHFSPQCDQCWRAANPKLVAPRVIEAYRTSEVCGSCGSTTESGIYAYARPVGQTR